MTKDGHFWIHISKTEIHPVPATALATESEVRQQLQLHTTFDTFQQLSTPKSFHLQHQQPFL